MKPGFSAKWQSLQSGFSDWLRHWLFSTDSGVAVLPPLEEMMRYSLEGGKHFRPVLYLLCLESLGQAALHGRRGALAIEAVHAYSLIHDDLPCMDDDDLRRGRPSCHAKFGEAQAVLAGDALLTLAFELLGGEPAEVAGGMAQELARAAGAAGMVGGQLLDLQATGQGGGAQKLEEIHRRKTGALISSCFSLAGLRARLPQSEVEKLRRFGLQLGLIFQVQDDILDETGDPALHGKSPGKDRSQGKLTYPMLLGLAGAREHLDRLLSEARRELAGLPLEARELSLVLDFLRERQN